MKCEEINDLENIGTVRRSRMTIEANTWGYEGIHESNKSHPLLAHINKLSGICWIHTVVNKEFIHESHQGRGVVGCYTVNRGARR